MDPQSYTPVGTVREVTYDSSRPFPILFQMYGSVWPKVLPYCIANVLLTSLVLYLFLYEDIDVTFSDKAHTFMSLMVSFLVVSRAQIVYARYMESRHYLSTAMRACRELIHHMCVLTLYEKGEKAKEWRNDVAFRTIVLLRSLCAALEYESSGKNAWEIPELEKSERDEIKKKLFLNNKLDSARGKLSHGERNMKTENFRVPRLLQYSLRKAIVSERDGKLETPLHINEELKILQFVSEFNKAFHGLKMLVFTPFPFPLIQMARTFLFFWVFTLPFSMVGDIKSWQVLIIIFFLSYGFIGLEYVSMELDDPFGDDPNDFDDLTFAQMAFEDIYIAINEIDGCDAASQLRWRVRNKEHKGVFESFTLDEFNSGQSALPTANEMTPLVEDPSNP
mmetsp:Transcript_50900/g.75437  ORF Transcript_50900/g.75437 Transcript_50900/m.75437 type:complete len:392 (-) Transcript_50900:383-1558(-)|eukprot:CAMPEP_0195519578 /NCGR_PEP_ID=MMETSP0794_2-20130614/15087_1 /TAXON_ID=515487 /ORGANISM="Stephanopyxis turris, Strain CCMP 815" /LENGTH=391 /DNA_ID=CAMNT_0040648759 /DNA_START=146 /DNA_END=1321 /DNA_ORIENTATION=+